VVNYAEGVKDRPYQPGILFEGLATPQEIQRVKEVEAAFAEIALKLLPELVKTPRNALAPGLWNVTAARAISVPTGTSGSDKKEFRDARFQESRWVGLVLA